MSLAPILVTCGIDEAIAIITEEKENIKNLQNAIQLKEYFLIFKTHNTIKMMLGMPLFVFIKARLTTKFNKTIKMLKLNPVNETKTKTWKMLLQTG